MKKCAKVFSVILAVMMLASLAACGAETGSWLLHTAFRPKKEAVRLQVPCACARASRC